MCGSVAISSSRRRMTSALCRGDVAPVPHTENRKHHKHHSINIIIMSSRAKRYLKRSGGPHHNNHLLTELGAKFNNKKVIIRKLMKRNEQLMRMLDDHDSQQQTSRRECPICFHNRSDNKALMPCGHIFCCACADAEGQMQQCPICERQVNNKLRIYI